MRSGKNILIAISLLFSMVLVIIACSAREEQQQAANAISVKTANVTSEEISLPVHTSGKLAPSTEIKLSFKTGGIISRINKDEGAKVKKGTVLARLDLSEINSHVAQAKEGYEKAERDLARIENLYKDEVVTLEQLQNMRTAYKVAKSYLEIAEFNKKHSTIIAPSDGRILKRFSEEDEITGPGTPVFLFGSENSGWIAKVGITDKDLVNVSLSDSAEVSVDAYPGYKFKASVTEIGAAANPYTGMFEVELTLISVYKKLSSGFVVKADIFPSQKETHTIIPIEALFEAKGNEGYVFTYNPQTMTAEKKEITIDRILSDKIVINRGLEFVEKVITDGVEYLSGGQKIVVK